MAEAQGQTWIWATQELGRGQLQDRGARRWLARSKVKEKEEEEQTCSKQHQPHLSCTWPCKRALRGPWKRSSTKQGLAKGPLFGPCPEAGPCKRAHWVLQKGSHPNLPTVSPGQKGRKNANERNEMQEHHMKPYEII